MAEYQAETVFVPVIPSFRGFSKTFGKGVTPLASAAGIKSGIAFAKGFSTKATVATATKKLAALQKEAADQAEKAAKRVAEAEAAKASALRKSEVAQEKAAQATEKAAAAEQGTIKAAQRVAAAQDRAAKATNDYGEESEQAKKALDQLAKETDRAKKSAQQYDSQSTQAKAALDRYEDAAHKAKTATNQLEKEQKSATDQADKYGKKIGEQEKSLKRSSSAWGKVGKVAKLGAVAAGGALAGLGYYAADFTKKSVNAAAGFQDTMRDVQTISGAGGKSIQQLTKYAMQMGAQTKYSAQDAATAMLALTKGGLTPAQIQAGALQKALTLAAAGGLDLGDAAGYIVTGMTTFGIKANDAGRITTALAGAANASTADISDLGFALQQVGPVAAQIGLSMEDTTATLAAFADNGVKGSDAGTSLKTMLARLQPQTDAAAKVMKSLGIITKDGANAFYDQHGKIKSVSSIAGTLQNSLKGMTAQQKQAALQTMFGSDAQRAAMILQKEGAAGLAKYMKAVRDKGAAEKQAAAKTAGFSGAMERFHGAIESAQIAFGLQLIPVLTRFVNWASTKLLPALSSMVNWLGPKLNAAGQVLGRTFNFIGDHSKVFLVIGAAVATFAAALKITNTVAKITETTMLAVNAAQKAYVFLMGIATKSALVQTAVLKAQGLALKAGAAAQWLLNAAMDANPIGIIIVAIGAVVAGLTLFFTKTEIGRKIWAKFMGAITAAARPVWGWLKKTFIPIFTEVKNALAGPFAWAKKNWPLLLGILTGPIGFAVSKIIKHFGAIKDAFGKLIHGDFRGAAKAFGGIFKSIGAEIVGGVKPIVGAAVNFGGKLIGGIITGAKAAIPKLIKWVIALPGLINSKAKALAAGLVGRGKSLISGLVSGASAAVPKIIAFFKSIPGKIAKGVGSFTKWVSSHGPEIIKGLANGAKKALPIIVGVFVGIPLLLVAAIVGAAALIAYTATTMIIELAKAVGSAIGKKLQPIFTSFGTWMSRTFKKTWDKLTGIITAPITAAVKGASNAWSKVTAVFTSITGWAKSTWKKGWSSVSGWITSPVGTARDSIGKILGRNGVQSKFNSITSWVKGTWSKSWKTQTAVLGSAVRTGRDVIGKLLSANSESVLAKFNSIKGWVKSTWAKGWKTETAVLGSAVRTGRDAIGKLLSSKTNSVLAKFTSITGWVKGTWKLGWKREVAGLSGAVQTGRDRIGSLLTGKSGSVSAKFNSIKSWVKSTWKLGWANVKGWLTGPVSNARDVIGKALGDKTSGVRAKLTSIKTWAKSTWKPGWANVKGWLSSPVSSGRNAIAKFLSGKTESVAAKFTSIKSKIGGNWKKEWARARYWMSDPISKGKTAIGSFLRGLYNSMKTWITRLGGLWANLKKPIRDVIASTASFINAHFIKGGINWLLTKIGVDKKHQVPWIPPIPQFAEGGRSIGNTRQRGGTDRILMFGDHGEMHVNRKSTRKLDKALPGGLDYLNKTGKWPVGPAAETRGVDQNTRRGPGVPITMQLPPELRKIARRGPGPQDRGGWGGVNPIAFGESHVGQQGWYNKCLAFVNAAWDYTVSRFSGATARVSMNAGPRSMDGVPPAGAAGYWDTGWAGHIALSNGDGRFFSNDVLVPGRIDLVNKNLIDRWGPYMGWWHPSGAKAGSGGGITGAIGGAISGAIAAIKGMDPMKWLTAKAAHVGATKVAGGLLGAGLVSKLPAMIVTAGKAWLAKQFASFTGGGSSTWSGGNVGSWAKDQLNNAATIISVAQSLGMYPRGAQIALMTAMQESTLKNINYGDRDSIGLFQQRNPWGSSSDRLNPAVATKMFLTGGHGGQPGLNSYAWRSLPLGVAAQRVQVSAFPDAYNKWQDDAAAILSKQATLDHGGFLQPGWTAAFNGTRKPEPVFTNPQWESIKNGSGGDTIINLNGGVYENGFADRMLKRTEAAKRRAANKYGVGV